MISREELYRLVWAEPMIKVAERFDVSGSYLARVCTVLNVPRPERGYWSKLAVGQAPKAEPLPDARPGDQISWSKDGELQVAPKPRLPPRRRLDTPVRIPRTKLHGLVLGAKEHFENSRPVDEGAYLRPFKKLLVDVTTSKDCLDKALDLANDLFNAFESVGHRVVIAPPDEHLRGITLDEREVRGKQRNPYYHSGLWSPNRPTVVYIGSVAVGLSVVEMSEDVLMRYVNGKYIRDADYVQPVRFRDYTWTTTRTLPTGRLRLVAYSPYWRVSWSADWQETRQTSLRSLVKSIVPSVEAAAADLVGKLEEADRQIEIERIEREAAEERCRREEDRRRVEQSIQDSKEHLGKVIQQWSNLMSIERFLSGVEQRTHELPDDDRVGMLERLRLARDFLGTQDPLDFFRSWKTPQERYRSKYPGTGSGEANP